MNSAADSSMPTKLEGKFKAIVMCWFLGFGTLIAWNSMLTIGDYYYALFPKYHPSRVLTLVYQTCALSSMAVLTYYESKMNTRKRIMFGFTLFTLSTFGLLMVDVASSGKGGIGSFMAVCSFIAAFGVLESFVQGGLVGDLAFMSPEFLQSYFCGLAASGAVTSGLRLITKASFDKTSHGLRKGVILFLAISTFFEILCIFLYAFFGKLPIVKYFRKKAASEGSKTVAADLAAVGIQTTQAGFQRERLSIKQLLRRNIDYALDLYIIFALTLSIFPGFLYENTGNHRLGSWYPVVLIATYNAFDLVSRYIPLVGCFRLESRKKLVFACLSRFVFIPCFYFTAKYGDEGWMIMLVSLLGLSNGYLTVCVFTAAPKGYTAPEQNALGNLLVVALLCGIFSGVCLDWLWIIGNGSF